MLFWEIDPIERNGKSTYQVKQYTSSFAARDVTWDDWTCVLGWPVQGIWPKFSDGTDVNSVARSHCERYVATADDSGYVSLLNYSCVVEDAPGHVHAGHSSHVMCVRWSADDRFVMTAGGRDRALFMWRKREAGRV